MTPTLDSGPCPPRAPVGTPDLQAGLNPATWMLEVTGGSMATMATAVDIDWPDHFQGTEMGKQVEVKTQVRGGKQVEVKA